MANAYFCFHRLSDDELLIEVRRHVSAERQATARLIACLTEFDARRLYLGEGCSSLYAYCTQVLHLAEYAAYARIESARAARRYPVILDLLADGSLHLTAVGLLASCLTPENHREVLEAARHKSKREVEQLVARLRPRPDVAPSVRKLPAPAPSTLAAVPDAAPIAATDPAPLTSIALPPARPAVVTPLAPERYRVQFTATKETYDKLRRAQDLMRHTVPSGDPAVIFDRALTLLLEDLERTKCAAVKRPRSAKPASSASRHVPAAVKRAVWARDGGRCAFVGGNGRCGETGFLEFHHVVPFAAGGGTSVENLELRCRAHNAYEAEKYFSRPLFVREKRAAWDLKLGPDPVAWTDREFAQGSQQGYRRRDLWKLPELWTKRASPTALWKTTEQVFHIFHKVTR